MTIETNTANKPRSKKLAVVRCRGGKFGPIVRLSKKYSSCAEAHSKHPPQICESGCLGLSDCVKACKIKAIQMLRTRLPEVDRDNCTGCGKCRDACPRDIILLTKRSEVVHVNCLSQKEKKDQETVCIKGCEACQRCITACPSGSITIENNIAVIHYETCLLCGLCAEWCPNRCISFQSYSGKFRLHNPLSKL